MKTLHHRLKENYEEISNNQDLISELVEKNRDLELKIEALEKGLSVQGKTIKSLEHEITDYSEDATEIESERISELEKKVLYTESKLKDAEKRIQSLTIIKETMYGDYKSEVNDLKRQIDLSENHKKSKNDLISKLQDEIKTLNQLIEDQKATFSAAREARQNEHASRVLELKNTITELENQIQELMLKGDSKSFYEYSLEDELSTLEEIKNKTILSRNSTMRENYAESLLAVGDMQTEKEFRIQILEQEKAVLQKQVDELQLQVFTLSNRPNTTEQLESEIDILKSEIIRLEVQLVVSTESWADENNRLREAIDEAELVAIEAKMQYAEAATDRDIYLKQYQDLKQSKKGKFTNFFKRNTRS
jgi:chromosome segregation ATPase